MKLLLLSSLICSSFLLSLPIHSHKLQSQTVLFNLNSSPVTFRNSTSSIYQLDLVYLWDSIIMLDIESSVLVMNSKMKGGGNKVICPFICEGILDLRSICVLDDSISSISYCKEETKPIGPVDFSRVYLWECTFKDLELCESGGSLVHYGVNGLEDVEGCTFLNVSVKSNCIRDIDEGGNSLECIFRGNLVRGGVEGIYGEIVSGIRERTVRFVCLNSTFEECHTNRRRESNADYSNTNYTSRLVLSISESHTINNCTFTKCSTD